MIVNILQNLSHKCSNHNINIKYVDFEFIHYAINLNIASSTMIFNEFNYVFLLMF